MPYYVVKGNKVLVRCNYEPSQEDLDTRGEKAVFQNEIISLLDAEFVGGRVVGKPPDETPQEKKDRVKRKQLIHKKMHEMAEEALKEEGKL